MNDEQWRKKITEQIEAVKTAYKEGMLSRLTTEARLWELYNLLHGEQEADRLCRVK